jgi:hypothetical protein
MIALGAALTVSAHGERPTPLPRSEAPMWRKRFYWIAAAAVPSALTLGVTLHITTDVASAPMLWVIPLALYLLTFVLAFMKGAANIEPATLLVHPVALALMVMSYYATGNWVASVSGILGGFFFSALVCHLALARSRPPADRLTEFYLFVSLGGVLGGAFAALAAPVIFNNVYEYPLALAAACLFRPRAESEMPRLTDASFAASLMVAAVALLLLRLQALDATIVAGALGAAAAMVAAGWGDESRPTPMRYAFLAVAAVHAGLVIWTAFNIDTIFLRQVVADETQLTVVQPWGALLAASSLVVLMFAAHATVQRRRDNRRLADFAFGATIPTLLLLIMLVLMRERLNTEALTVIGILICGVAIFFNRGKPLMLAAIVLAAFAIIFLDDYRGGRVLTQERTFFGVMRTREFAIQDPQVPPLRILLHGTTLHGAQIAAPALSRQPLTYYHPRTALGEAILAGLSTADEARLALIGLGTGSTACLMRESDSLTIFEIDPAIVRLATAADGDFTFVRECQPGARVEVGDARLRIADEPEGFYDVVVVDAFSSDAIPAHLLTREAIALYLSKTRETGVVVLHLSNRHLALVSEAARVARDLNAPTLYRLSHQFDLPGVSLYGASSASVMIIARTPEALAALPLMNEDWRVIEAPPGRAWTDDYINLARALWDGLTGAEECRLNPEAEACQADAPSDAAAPQSP